jgi:hypothetical protein
MYDEDKVTPPMLDWGKVGDEFQAAMVAWSDALDAYSRVMKAIEGATQDSAYGDVRSMARRGQNTANVLEDQRRAIADDLHCMLMVMPSRAETTD